MTRDDVECTLKYAQLFIKDKHEDFDDVVTYLNYCYNGRAHYENGEYYSHSFDKFIKLGSPDPNSFTPILSLTLPEIDQWIRSIVGEEQYQSDLNNLKDVLINIVEHGNTKVLYVVEPSAASEIRGNASQIQP